MKPHTQTLALIIGCSLIFVSQNLYAQGFGGFGGAGNTSGGRSQSGSFGQQWSPGSETPLLQPEVAMNYITIEGTADIRIKPEGIRLVLAITSQAETAEGCQTQNNTQVQAVRKAWLSLKIPEENIVEDFINVLPVYEWHLAEREGQQVRVQEQVAYRMQSNLHLSIKTEADAMAAIKLAFEQGVTDIVTFDYWSSELDEQKKKARAEALTAAKEKAETLLSVFSEQPKVINIQESTAVFYPHSLYQTYENVLEEQVQYSSSWRDKPAIKAYRPKMTFYQGLKSRADKRPKTPAMRPEISVVSTVRIYYQSPADKPVVPRGQ